MLNLCWASGIHTIREIMVVTMHICGSGMSDVSKQASEDVNDCLGTNCACNSPCGTCLARTYAYAATCRRACRTQSGRVEGGGLDHG